MNKLFVPWVPFIVALECSTRLYKSIQDQKFWSRTFGRRFLLANFPYGRCWRGTEEDANYE